MDYFSINKRIELLVEYFCDSNNTKFANAISTSEANVRNYISGTLPKFDTLNKIVIEYKICSEWLLTGEGEMLKEPAGELEGDLFLVIKQKDERIEEISRKVGKLENIIELKEEQIKLLEQQLQKK